MKELHLAVIANVRIVLVRMEEDVEEGGERKRMPPLEEGQWKGTMEADDELERMKARKCVASRNAIPHPGTLLTVPETFNEILNIIREEHCKGDPPTNNGIHERHSSSEKVENSAQVKAILVMNLMRWKHLRSVLRLLVSLLVLLLAPPVATLPHPGGIEEIGSEQRCRVATPCVDKRRCAEGKCNAFFV